MKLLVYSYYDNLNIQIVPEIGAVVKVVVIKDKYLFIFPSEVD
jgi:hypothetical protein